MKTNAKPQVSIYSNSSDNPDSRLCKVESLDGYETGLRLSTGDWPDELYAGSCASITLAATTSYWIVFESSEELPSSFWNVARATGGDQDAGSVSGWRIDDISLMKTRTLGDETSWVRLNYPFAFGIYATAK